MNRGKKRERENPCFMCLHYHDYAAGEMCAVCGHSAPLPQVTAAAVNDGAFPTEIIPGFLFLGSYDNASRSELNKSMGIKAILNVRYCDQSMSSFAQTAIFLLSFL